MHTTLNCPRMNKLLGDDAIKVKSPVKQIKSNDNNNDIKISNCVINSENNEIIHKEQPINIEGIQENKEKINSEENKIENKPHTEILNLEGSGTIIIDQNENNEFLNKLGNVVEEEEEDD